MSQVCNYTVVFIGMALALFSVASCQQVKFPENSESVKERLKVNLVNGHADWITIDSAYKAEVDTIVYDCRRRVFESGEKRQSAFGNRFTKKDSMSYQISNGELVYASVMIDSPHAIKWLEYYLDQGELIFSRHRAWFKDFMWGFAEELMIYFKDGEIYYVEDRMLRVDSRYSNAGGLRMLDYKPTVQPKYLVEKRVNDHWPYVLSTVREAMSKSGQG